MEFTSSGAGASDYYGIDGQVQEPKGEWTKVAKSLDWLVKRFVHNADKEKRSPRKMINRF
jgi:hypothetical protein